MRENIYCSSSSTYLNAVGKARVGRRAVERVIHYLYYLRIAFTSGESFSLSFSLWQHESHSPCHRSREVSCQITIPPLSVTSSPAFLDSVLRRAHSALSLNTPADLRNGWFPEQTTVDM